MMLTKCQDSRKAEQLAEILNSCGSLLVAFSGGVDSSFLLRMASDCLPGRVLAVTVNSRTRDEDEVARAGRLCREWGIRHLVLGSEELTIPQVAGNDVRRCYFCKSFLFARLLDLAREQELAWVADGTNADDGQGYRPGMQALAELGVRSPLREAGLTKSEIRRLSRDHGLPTWDLPTASCYLTRFPYGEDITEDKLVRVAGAEKYLENLGYRQVRVRVYGQAVRVEVAREQVADISRPEQLGKITEKLRALEYEAVQIDPLGFRSGSMDEEMSHGAKTG